MITVCDALGREFLYEASINTHQEDTDKGAAEGSQETPSPSVSVEGSSHTTCRPLRL